MVSKRGQLTIFIIVGVVVAVGVFAFLFYQSGAEKRYFDQEGIKGDVSSIKEYAIACFESVADNSFELVTVQGGYYNAPQNSEDFGNGTFLPYYSVEGVSYLPNLDSIESEMAKSADDVVGNCIHFAEFSNYEVSYSTVQTNVDIMDGDVVFTIDMPITISQEGHNMIIEMKEYPVHLTSKFKAMYNVAEYFNNDIIDDNEYCVNCLGAIAEANGVFVDVIGLDPTTSVVLLSEVESTGDGNSTYYMFLNKFSEDMHDKNSFIESYDEY